MSHTVREQRPPKSAAEERILDIAARMLASDEPFTMEELARRAAVSRATLYRRFPSREALAERLRADGRVPDGGSSGEGILAVDPARTRILEAARGRIVRDGPLHLTVDQVAADAGVNVTTIYRLFSDKDGLITAVLESLGPRREVAQLLSDDQAPVAEVLTRFVARLMQFTLDNPGLVRLLLQPDDDLEAQYVHRLRARQVSTFERLERYLARQRELGRVRDYSPRDMASALFGMILASTLLRPHLRRRPSPSPASASRSKRRQAAAHADIESATMDQRAHTLVALFLRGIANDERD